nr:retrovirus-related Pol polyprotein from transposon TNT 1-94 [Tanacetum cinerariifolium]
MILESVENCPLIWPSIEENRVTRPKKYSKLSATKVNQADCDVKTANIILQGIPPEVYALKYDDLIDAINHMMSFLTVVVTSRYPTTNNQLRNSSNHRQQATINDGRITLQPVQGRQISFASEPSLSSRPTKVEVPKELLKISMNSMNSLEPTLSSRPTNVEVPKVSMFNQELFQRDNSFSQQSALSFDQLFAINELNAQSQEKDMVGISDETSIARSPQQNNVIKRRNHTLIEAASTIKTPYELLHDKLPELSFFNVFGALYYPTNDSENLGKLQPKADIGIFIGYAPIKKAFQIYNRRTRRIIKTIHVDFDDLTAMASKQSSLGPTLHEMTPVTISSGLVPNPTSSTPFVPPLRTDWDMLFQPLFDELLVPPPSVDHPSPEVIALIAKVVALEPVASIVHLPQQQLFKMHHHLSYKDALTQFYWIKEMQEELNEFERLE